MRSFWAYPAILVVALAAALAAPGESSGQVSEDLWVLLGTIETHSNAKTDSVDLSRVDGRSKAIRLVAKAGGMTLQRVAVSYANGQVHFEDRPPELQIKLNASDRTKPIDPRDEDRFVDKVEVTYAPEGPPAPNAKLDVWGLQSPAGRTAKRGTPVVSAPPGGPEALIATKRLSVVVDRDVVTFDPVQHDIAAVRIRATDRAVSIVSVDAVNGSGASSRLDFQGEIGAGASSPWIAVGRASLQELRLAYRPEPAAGGSATIEIYASTIKISDKGLPPEAVKAEGYVEVPVFFGTDREREADRPKNGRNLVSFSGQGGAALSLGRSIVTIPTSKDREQGAISRPDWDLIFFSVAFRDEDPTRDFTLQSIDVLSEDAFASAIKERMRSAKVFKDQAFVFVHGYRVGFDDALFRTAQISHDIGFDGAAFVFSWPSSGSLWGYNHDQKRVLGSRDDFRHFLDLVRRETGAKKIHLIAHSMGNVLLMETMRDLAESAPTVGSTPIFNEIILAAPDVTRDNFIKIAERMRPLASGVTLYASAKDKALKFSGDIALGEIPAGAIPKSGIPVIVKGVESIDISAISTDVFNLNHSEFADRKALLGDMETLIKAGTHPPESRLNAFEKMTVESGTYWRYRLDKR